MTSPEPGTSRIIDAARNRAREGLRVLEDLARFVLDDQVLSEQAKIARHALADEIGNLPVETVDLLDARDTPHDVGTAISTGSEKARPTHDSIAAAAAARTTEALRSLEEATKLLEVDSAPFESLRYQTYELERGIRLRLQSQARQWRLCVLITGSMCTLPWQAVALASIKGGAESIQLREKTLDDHDLLARARELVELAEGRADVIINDRPDIALMSGAAGVHLGQTDLPVAAVRTMTRHRLCIGVSCTNIEQARQAASDGADYLGLGPMFPTQTKNKPALAGPALIRACLEDDRTRSIPHLAIGGIGPENMESLVRAGARGVAVCRAVCSSEHPERICRETLAYLHSENEGTPPPKDSPVEVEQ